MRTISLLLIFFLFFSCQKQQPIQEQKTYHKMKKAQNNLQFTIMYDADSIYLDEEIHLILQTKHPENTQPNIPYIANIIKDFEITPESLSEQKWEQTESGEKFLITESKYTLEPNHSGPLSIPAIPVSFSNKEKTETLTSDEILIDVQSLTPERREKLQIKDNIEIQEIHSWKKYHYALALSILLYLLIFLYYYLQSKKEKKQILPPPIPAHIIALKALDHLLEQNLLEKGMVKSFYQQINEILRQYIENRYGIQAPEQTTEEFFYELPHHQELQQHQELLQEYFTHCDLVKYAKFQPPHNEIHETIKITRQFIDKTKQDDRSNS